MVVWAGRDNNGTVVVGHRRVSDNAMKDAQPNVDERGKGPWYAILYIV